MKLKADTVSSYDMYTFYFSLYISVVSYVSIIVVVGAASSTPSEPSDGTKMSALLPRFGRRRSSGRGRQRHVISWLVTQRLVDYLISYLLFWLCLLFDYFVSSRVLFT